MLVTERKLAIMSGICAVVGLAVLFLVAAITELPLMSASEAAGLSTSQGSTQGNTQGSNAKVRVHGFVDSVTATKSYSAIKIAAVESVEAVSFDTGYIGSLGLKRFQEVEATGEFRGYNGKNSFIVTKIRPLNGSMPSIPCGG
ncbi:hypothetical protein HYV83_03470 [Candidatus Woesearchaeota archaeon]|nr:hypothetical protein [Candidatus Woesearchaeota archaeon]